MTDEKRVVEIGNHRLVCGDVTVDAVETVLAGQKADVVYTDPPWGPGMLQMFATLTERGLRPRLSWWQFLEHVARLLADGSTEHAPVFVEMGFGPENAWVNGLDRAMISQGFDRVSRWETTYGPYKMRQTVNYYARTGAPRHVEELGQGLHGIAPLRKLLSQVVRPGVSVLDPFIGLGNTAKVVHRLGGRVLGTELNPARLDRTVQWLRKATGQVER